MYGHNPPKGNAKPKPGRVVGRPVPPKSVMPRKPGKPVMKKPGFVSKQTQVTRKPINNTKPKGR
jgi:hypothetical protein